MSGSSGEVLLTARLCSSESLDKKTAPLQTNLDSKAAVITNQWEGTAHFMRQTAARTGCRWRASSCQQATRMQCKPQGTHWWELHLHKGLLTSQLFLNHFLHFFYKHSHLIATLWEVIISILIAAFLHRVCSRWVSAPSHTTPAPLKLRLIPANRSEKHLQWPEQYLSQQWVKQTQAGKCQ